jgi:hypothetical protein
MLDRDCAALNPTFLASEGGIEFLRALAKEGLRHRAVVGSSGRTGFEMRDGKPVLVK